MNAHTRPHPVTTRGAGTPPLAERSWRDVARGGAAALVLLTALVGLPVLLVVTSQVSWPTQMPTWDQISTALTRPDDGHLFLGALTVAGWIAWALFAFSTVVEVTTTLRGIPTPRIPFLRLPQGAAAALVATAAVLLTPTLHAPPARANTTTQVSSRVADSARPADTSVLASFTATESADRPTDSPMAADPRHLPVVTVQRGDTLWSLAAHHLGDGTRFTQIADLNYHRPQPDGRTLTTAHWIYPGWQLRLPADATDLTQPRPQPQQPQPVPPHHRHVDKATGDPIGTPDEVAASAAEHAQSGTYVVRRGDTLWDIAADHLGDPRRYREVFDLNAGRQQPDGDTLADPSLIMPGWRLRLPPVDRPLTQPKAPDHHAPHAQLPRPAVLTPPLPAAVTQLAPDATQRPAGIAIPAPIPAPSQRPTTTQENPTPPEGLTPTARSDASEVDSPPAAQTGMLVAGLTALAATGIIGEITRRRRHQQRRRRAGERIAMPPPDSLAHQQEQDLRAGVTPTAITVVMTGLRHLAERHAAAGFPLPRVLALRVSPLTVELILDAQASLAPDAVIAPFCPRDASTWTASWDDVTAGAAPSMTGTSTDEDALDVPYPALVTLGVTDDAVVLLNLEAAGSLAIVGERAYALPVIRALACELATNQLATRCSLRVDPELSGLGAVTDPSRLRVQNIPDMATALRARHTLLQDAFAQTGNADALAARVSGTIPEAGNPQIYLATSPAPFDCDPWSSLCAITVAPDAVLSGWTLHVGPDSGGISAGRLEPLGVDLDPSTLTDTAYDNLLELLTFTQQDSRPAPPEPEALPNHDPDAWPPSTRWATAALHTGPPITGQVHLRIDSELPRTTGPRVMLLGPVRVQVAGGRDDPRGRRITELITYLTLHPGIPGPALDDALWHGQRISRATRNTLIYRARGWLGDTEDGTPYLSHADPADGYRLHPAVTCDWDEFRHHAHNAHSPDADPATELQAALDLVRGRPFLGVDPAGYTWADNDIQTMISAIIDVAHELSDIHLSHGDTRAAQEAAARGLAVEPVCELLYRDALTAAAMRGDGHDVRRLEQQLRKALHELDPDMDLDDDTLDLLDQIRRRDSQPA